MTDWEEFKTRSPPFSDLFLFATSYGLSFPWKLGRWTEPAVAFRATYFAVTWLARLVREFFLTYCQTMETTPRLLGIFFPVFLAEQALEQRGKSGARAWRNLFHFYAQREGPACFD
ncbi:MAG: hypothetical protein HY650_06275 [Acidobacteria bacterium]|nr:hypothetical protein [Acidobacteriota bacterium]